MRLSLSFACQIGLLSCFLASVAAWAEESSLDKGEAVAPPAVVKLQATVQKTENYPINLETVIKLVEDQNLLIAKDRKNTEIFKSRYRQRQAALLPSIEGSLNQSRLEGGQQVFGGEVFTVVRTTVQPQLTASWTLYPGGKNIYEMLAAKRREQSAGFLLKETYQEQLAGAAQDYYKLLAAHLKKGVIVRSLLQAEEQVKLNEAKVKAGNGIPLDLSRARTNYAQQVSNLLQAETAIIQAEQDLLNRLNLDSSLHLVPDVAEAQRRELVSDERTVQAWLAESLPSHPSLQNMQAELKALGMDYKATRSDLIPSVTVRAYTNGTGPDWNSLTRTSYGGFSVNMNLFENLGLQVPLRMQEKKKLVEQKTLELQNLTRNIESQVVSAYLSSQNYKSAIEAAQQEVDAAQESYDLAVGRFKAGYGINLDVLDAGAALETARNNLVQAILNYNQAQVQLVQALGKVSPDTLLNGLRMEGKADDAKAQVP